MAIRTTQSTVTFMKPFQIDGMEENQPPGDYRVDMDEELLEGLSFLAYRRIAALIHLPAISKPQNPIQIVRIAPAEFDAMLQLDGAAARAVGPS
ncbi:hypothetical protein GCM10007874_19750 [Labrys miyagiensis]|uniref:Uncharacterized protein n=1 Tax=Labrys miyagiensis TaxID=346912 RepID=A0ABQ6CFA8_9HYPH|nr:hypothetical protein [Labrys miyagiensis]GLS18958.1 hypothetical protein GCM10007874_19750 [Labrys miyagiensis]